MSKHITPSLIISIIALVIALGGASYAAIQIPKNSVGTAQLKKNAVSKAKLSSNSVNSSKVKNQSLLRKDFKSGQLPGTSWYADRQPFVPLLPLTSEFQTVVSTPTLPAGRYLAFARANLSGAVGDSSVICSLEGDAAQNFTVGGAEGVALAMSSPAVLNAPRKIELNCLSNGGNPPSIAQAHVIVTRVTEIRGALP